MLCPHVFDQAFLATTEHRASSPPDMPQAGKVLTPGQVTHKASGFLLEGQEVLTLRLLLGQARGHTGKPAIRMKTSDGGSDPAQGPAAGSWGGWGGALVGVPKGPAPVGTHRRSPELRGRAVGRKGWIYSLVMASMSLAPRLADLGGLPPAGRARPPRGCGGPNRPRHQRPLGRARPCAERARRAPGGGARREERRWGSGRWLLPVSCSDFQPT